MSALSGDAVIDAPRIEWLLRAQSRRIEVAAFAEAAKNRPKQSAASQQGKRTFVTGAAKNLEPMTELRDFAAV